LRNFRSIGHFASWRRDGLRHGKSSEQWTMNLDEVGRIVVALALRLQKLPALKKICIVIMRTTT